jgi:hypothetical protein
VVFETLHFLLAMTDLWTLVLDEVCDATSFLVKLDNVGCGRLLGRSVGGTTNDCLIYSHRNLQATLSTLDLDPRCPEQDDMHVHRRSDCCSSQTSNDDDGHEDDSSECNLFVLMYDHDMNDDHRLFILFSEHVTCSRFEVSLLL